MLERDRFNIRDIRKRLEAHCTVQSLCSQSGNVLYIAESKNIILGHPLKKSVQHFKHEHHISKT